MKKNGYLMIAAFLIIIALYNIVLFSIVQNYTPTFWSAYGFTILAMIVASITYPLSLKGGKDASFLNVPIIFVATAYFFVQLLLGVVLMAIPNLSIVFSNIVQIIVLAAFLIISIGGLIGKNVTVATEREVREKVFYIKSLAADVEGLVANVSDSTHQKALTNLSEAIRYSDPMGHPSLNDLNQEITTKVSSLTDSVKRGSTDKIAESCAEIERLVADRNRKCKLMK